MSHLSSLKTDTLLIRKLLILCCLYFGRLLILVDCILSDVEFMYIHFWVQGHRTKIILQWLLICYTCFSCYYYEYIVSIRIEIGCAKRFQFSPSSICSHPYVRKISWFSNATRILFRIFYHLRYTEYQFRASRMEGSDLKIFPSLERR
jgi:hypothetical protein